MLMLMHYISRQPYLSAPAVGTYDDEVQVLSIKASELDISSLKLR